MIALELQLPVMGYDIAAEMSQHRIFSGLRNSESENLGRGAPLANEFRPALFQPKSKN